MILQTRLTENSVVKKTLNKLAKLASLTTNISNRPYTFDKFIWKQIEQGLEFGYEPKYFMNSNLYCPSIEDAYIDYTNGVKSDDLETLYNAIVKVLELVYISDKVELITGVEENNVYFQIKFK